MKRKLRQKKPDPDGNCAACDYSDGCGTCYAPPGVCEIEPPGEE